MASCFKLDDAALAKFSDVEENIARSKFDATNKDHLGNDPSGPVLGTKHTHTQSK